MDDQRSPKEKLSTIALRSILAEEGAEAGLQNIVSDPAELYTNLIRSVFMEVNLLHNDVATSM